MTQPSPELQARMGHLSGLIAGYVGHQTVKIGLDHGIFQQLAAAPEGMTPADLAAKSGLDPFYLEVWCRSAHAAGAIEAAADLYKLDPVTAGLLTDRDSPAYIGGMFKVLAQPEMFDVFSSRFSTGERTWWDQVSSDFIRGVAETSRPAYLRLIPGGLARIPGLEEALKNSAEVMDLACGAGFGLVHLARTYPSTRLVGVDGDAFSLELASANAEEAGVADRVELIHSTLEDFERPRAFDAVLINLSMHECRDPERVTGNVLRSLRPGGHFVISDFPFPEGSEGLQTLPGRIMSGIQFFEAQIDDQLLPTRAFMDLLDRHGFADVDAFEITPTHAVTHGRAPQ